MEATFLGGTITNWIQTVFAWLLRENEKNHAMGYHEWPRFSSLYTKSYASRQKVHTIHQQENGWNIFIPTISEGYHIMVSCRLTLIDWHDS